MAIHHLLGKINDSLEFRGHALFEEPEGFAFVRRMQNSGLPIRLLKGGYVERREEEG
jgi:hypothetical protein